MARGGAGGRSRSGRIWLYGGGFAAGLSLPLFQTGFHRFRWQTSYADTHYHVWTNAISAGGALAFTGLSWIVLFLVSRLLDLVGIPLDKLIGDAWFGWTFSGAAFGAALGVLRNQLKIIGTLQSLVLSVFSLLAVPVALAVVIFLAAVIVSGPGVLWDATDSATPLLLAIAAGSFVLVNAVVRDDAESMSGNAALRIAARVLALGILPLTVFAAISMGVRINQHGLSPERLWGLAAIVVAVVFGVAYFVDMVRGWKVNWPERLRGSNLKLAVGAALYALVLALPVLNFGAISTSSQLARLDSGAVPAEEFDFDALKWDFGEPGREALAQLARHENSRIAQLALDTRRLAIRPYGETTVADRRAISEQADLSSLNGESASAVRSYLRDEIILCREGCRAVDLAERPEGTLVALMTRSDYGRNPHLLLIEPGKAKATAVRIIDGRLVIDGEEYGGSVDADGQVELRPFSGYRVYVDGKPTSQPFE